MSKKPRRRQDAANNAAQPFFKKAWFVLGVVGTIISAIFTFLLNAPTILENIRNLPTQIGTTYDQYLSWVYEDAEWTGNWSSYPEGAVDMADLKLSNTDMKITIWAAQGAIDGTIVTGEICKAVPFDFVLLRGEVSGNRAEVFAFDIIAGEHRDFAKLELVRTGDVMTVTPTDGMKQWFPSEARLGRHLDNDGKEPEPDLTTCRDVRAHLLQDDYQQE
jgi:hypothetical protein